MMGGDVWRSGWIYEGGRLSGGGRRGDGESGKEELRKKEAEKGRSMRRERVSLRGGRKAGYSLN
jgi:hypothetical protein